MAHELDARWSIVQEENFERALRAEAFDLVAREVASGVALQTRRRALLVRRAEAAADPADADAVRLLGANLQHLSVREVGEPGQHLRTATLM